VPSPSTALPSPGTDLRRTITLAREQPQPPAAAVKKDTGISSLLSLGRGARTLPEDFKIGRLGDARIADSDERQAVGAASTFLAGLADGKVDAGLIAPDSKARVSDTVSFGIERGNIPRSYRIGAPRKRETGELSATVRLFGPVGTSEGEITMARSGKQWLVDDFQINLSALKEKREKPKERFFPSSYRWMLEN
jgi:hypothetical protein